VFVAARVKQMLEDNGRCSASGRSRSMDSFDFARLCRLLACEAVGCLLGETKSGMPLTTK
jgi:hypothetical protein